MFKKKRPFDLEAFEVMRASARDILFTIKNILIIECAHVKVSEGTFLK